MLRAGAKIVQGGNVRGRGITFVLRKSVAGIFRLHLQTVGVAGGLREDRGGGDQWRLGIALDDGGRVRQRGDGQPIDEDVDR